MPDAQTIINAIGTLGFPIAACCYLFYTMQKDREATAQQREADRKEHRDEMQKMTDALCNNTLVIQKLIDTLSPQK